MTPEQAGAMQMEMWRRLSPEERLRIIFAMIEDGFAMLATSIRGAHPEYTPAEFAAALRQRIYGTASSTRSIPGKGTGHQLARK